MDFRAPSLFKMFPKVTPRAYLNDLLDGKAEVDEVLVDMSNVVGTEGGLFIVFADPRGSSITAMCERAMNWLWKQRALMRMITARDELVRQGFEYLIIDTAPGYQMYSINAIVVSDTPLLVVRYDQLDLAGTTEMLKTIYEPLQKKPLAVVNKAPAGMEVKELESRMGLTVIATIPCFCDLLQYGSRGVFAKDYPEHAFSQHIGKLCDALEQ